MVFPARIESVDFPKKPAFKSSWVAFRASSFARNGGLRRLFPFAECTAAGLEMEVSFTGAIRD